MALSDAHIGKPSLGNYGIKLIEIAQQRKVDVLLFCGDLAEPDLSNPANSAQFFELGLESLARIPASVRLFVLGNNDLQQVRESKLTEHYDELAEWVGKYDFYLLDRRPVKVGGVAFVGNTGWYDGTLWTPYEGRTKQPNDREAIKRRNLEFFTEEEFPGRVPEGLTPHGFYSHCRDRIKEHLSWVEDAERLVLAIHHVPHADFLVEGDGELKARFAYLNWYMGSKHHAQHYQRAGLGLTAHTHRQKVVRVGKSLVNNVSGAYAPQIYEL